MRIDEHDRIHMSQDKIQMEIVFSKSSAKAHRRTSPSPPRRRSQFVDWGNQGLVGVHGSDAIRNDYAAKGVHSVTVKRFVAPVGVARGRCIAHFLVRDQSLLKNKFCYQLFATLMPRTIVA
jgi:hypothetical protein